MTNIVFTAVYGLLIGYGIGVRVALYHQRKAAKAAAAEIKAMVE